ncbi:Cytochrome p450 [Aspergillus sclerotialis]|uniref:Cytochrome p450 n=1 Tax=Aspergillus sclerotialis TaxID=2070753 RepID=A0A3A3A2P0_9EURO|nr:Cytochrome p450 [Aspergillus sclerotialis]
MAYLLAVVLISPFIYFLFHMVYNVYFHPLHCYPGPKLWAATHLFWVYYRVTGKLVWKSIDLHREYGTVVRVAPDQLSYTSETALKTIYGHRPVEMQKNCLAGFSRPGLRNVHAILSADQTNHARLRRVLAPALSETAVKEYDSVITKYVDLLMEKLAVRCEAPLDLNQWFEWTTLDIVSDIVCGEPARALERENGGPWLNILTASIQSQVWLQALEFYGLLPWRQYLLPKHMANAAIDNFRITSAKVETRLGRLNIRKDFFSYVLRHSDEKGMSTLEMKLNVATIIGAGTGTTATWLTTTVYNLACKPEIYRLLTDEIRSSFRCKEEITLASVSKLLYLSAVIKESLRIHSPSPSSLGRFVPERGEVIDGRFVPAGTTVGVHHHAAYHMSSNFYLPDDFCPERWLPEAQGSKCPFAQDNIGVMQPFSYGPRTCLGIRLAHAETRIILAKLLWNFDIEIMPEAQNWQDSSKGTVAWHRKAMKSVLIPRERK